MTLLKFFQKKPKTQKEALEMVYNLFAKIKNAENKYVSDINYKNRMTTLIEKMEQLISDYNLLEYDKELKVKILKPVYDILVDSGLVYYATKLDEKFEL